jgi:hypothetical protein
VSWTDFINEGEGCRVGKGRKAGPIIGARHRRFLDALF